MKKNHQSFYQNNKTYTDWLDKQDQSVFEKYVEYAQRSLMKKNQLFLDVGCGTGTALRYLSSKGYKAQGLEISQTSVREARSKNIKCKSYNGTHIPYDDESVDVVGSFNVLEHTDDPALFLNEQYRVLKKSGNLIIVCPNFLSISNNYHAHTRGLIQKSKNVLSLAWKLFIAKHPSFSKMQTIEREDFHPDDDAVNATNPVDIMLWIRMKKMKLIYWSSQENFGTGLKYSLDTKELPKLFLGACFFVLEK